jgi:hypothetical protein
MRDREFADKVAQLEQARQALRGKTPRSIDVDGKALSGDYNTDMDELLGKLEVERKRSNFLETQNRSLITQLESADRRTADAAAAAAELRASLAKKDDAATSAVTQLVDAEARIADAENRVNTILSDTSRAVAEGVQERDELLAEKLAVEDELEKLRAKVAEVEATITAVWDTERVEQSHLRERLNDIAADVSRLVYAVEGEFPDGDDTLLERVQRFYDEDLAKPADAPVPQPVGAGSSVSDRMVALRELQERS